MPPECAQATSSEFLVIHLWIPRDLLGKFSDIDFRDNFALHSWMPPDMLRLRSQLALRLRMPPDFLSGYEFRIPRDPLVDEREICRKFRVHLRAPLVMPPDYYYYYYGDCWIQRFFFVVLANTF